MRNHSHSNNARSIILATISQLQAGSVRDIRDSLRKSHPNLTYLNQQIRYYLNLLVEENILSRVKRGSRVIYILRGQLTEVNLQFVSPEGGIDE